MVSDFYNRYNLSVRQWCGKIKIFWLNGTHPSEILKPLIESGFTFDEQERCWIANSNNETETAAKRIIEVAEELRGGNTSRTESSFDSLEAKDEFEFFQKLKTPEDYKNFLENLEKDKDYIIHSNNEKWEERRKCWEEYERITANDDELRD